MGLQDLTGKEHQIEYAYKVSGRKCLRDIRTGLQGLIGSDLQIQPAYKVTGRGRRILRVRHIRSNLPTRYHVGVAGSHGLGTTDRTCLLGIRRWLQDLTGSKHEISTVLHYLPGSEHKIVHAYKVSGRGCKISLVRQTRLYMPTRY